MKKKLFIFAPISPPVTGSNICVEYLLDFLSSHFEVLHINTSISIDVNDIGVFSNRKIKASFLLCCSLIKNLFNNRFDSIVLVPALSGFALFRDILFIILSKIFRKNANIILWIHTNALFFKSNYQKKIILFFFNFSSHCVFVGENISIPYKLSYRGKINIIHNTIINSNYNIPVSFLNSARKKITESSEFNVLFLSNMIPDKGWPLLLSVARNFIKSYSNVNFIFAGGVPDNSINLITSEFEENSLNIRYVGPINGEIKNSFFLSADLFVLPTLYKNEAFPLVLLEALYYGLPVVSTNIGSISEIIDDNKGGLIIKPIYDDLYNAIEFMFHNEGFRNSCSIYNKEKFDTIFKSNIISNQWIEYFQNV